MQKKIKKHDLMLHGAIQNVFYLIIGQYFFEEK